MQSYARGPEGNVLRRTVGEVFLQTAARWPDHLAIVSRHQNVRWTWSEYAKEARRVAAGLQAAGLQPGDRVGVWATNCAEWVALQFGCALAGVLLVNVNPAYRTHELSYVLKKSQMKALFLHESDHRTNYRAVLEQSQELPLQTISLGREE